MSEQSSSGPQPVPHQAMYFVYTIAGILGLLILGWIIKMA